MPLHPAFLPVIRTPTGLVRNVQRVAAVPALPAPGLSTGPLRTQFADVYAAEEAQMAQAIPSATKDLVSELLRALRRTNITAGPPAHVRPHIWSNPIDLSATVTVPAAVGNYVAAVSFTVPDGWWARIEQYGINVQDAAYTYDGSILWGWRLAGTLLDQGMSNWGEQRGSMVFPRKTFIKVQQQQTIQFLVRRAVVAGAPQNVQMGFRGWTWRLRNNYEGTQASVTAY